MFHNTNRTKYNSKIQLNENTNVTKCKTNMKKYKWNKIQIQQNAKIPKY